MIASGVSVTSSAELAPPRTLRHRRPRRLGVQLAIIWLAFISAAALLADLVPLADPSAGTGVYRQAPFAEFPEFLGTDQFGRSMLSRSIHAARISLPVGLISATLGMVVGGALGVLAGTRHRRLDELLGATSDAILSFPALVLIIALTAVWGRGVSTMIIGLSIASAPMFFRIARANTLRVRDREFVIAARLLGATPTWIVVREVLPSVIRSILVLAPVVVASLIVAEASLSFLGLGVAPPTATWGVMIAQGRSELRTDPSMVIVPSAFLFLTVAALYAAGGAAGGALTKRRSSGA